MQDNETNTWLARDGDGRVLEVDAAGHPGAEATPSDGRPVAEAADTDAERERRGAAAEAEAEQRFADYWGGTGPDYEAKAGQGGEPWPEAPWWDGEKMHSPHREGAAERDWEAEAGQ